MNKIAKKIEELLKNKIIDEGLVNTGTLLDSIRVTYNDKGEFFVEAEDYFKYLDKEYGLSNSVLDSEELANMIAEVIVEDIEKNI